MRNCLWIVLAVFALAGSSCNLRGDQATETPPPTPTIDTPPSIVPTPTLVPIETLLAIATPTVTLTSTPGVTLASPKDQPVNCRFGPGPQYGIAGALNPGRQAEMIGRNEDSSWWYVRNPSDPSTLCWLSAAVTDAVGNVEALPVVEPPQIGVTSVTVSVDPPFINAACDAPPQTFVLTVQIATNGPSIVVWRWETSAGKSSPEKDLLFGEGGTKTVQDFFQVDGVSDYWIHVRTLQPNVVIGEASFKVTCTP